jgi:prefoldin beta subunit|tara:strand:+ start:226 stop:555 length:330 start_codon:yes stop_codon:yes gene_type:complete
MDENMQKKVMKLQMMEQKLQGYAMQKQNFQGQILEIENALLESKTSEEVYKMVGQLMIKSDKDKILKELEEKDAMFKEKIKDIENQEAKIREELTPLQEEVMGSLKNDK